ncbi:hypothetical protein [Zooshikella ganghwensis]|uniref:Uncharacterized protein n=1 Tax=Zooshikella ganghwensis TaxID=202772 RepID=A0A4V1IMS1_9GAMM|nr:hypothetical protein [Zooshikella ganghwensis]RDH41211.1 hypothetical protein B9G39_29895 [Zooshikella ganghwensis]
MLGRPKLKDNQGRYTASPAIRAFNKDFFGILGLDSALKHERDKRKKKEVKLQNKQQKTAPNGDSKVNKSAQHRIK